MGLRKGKKEKDIGGRPRRPFFLDIHLREKAEASNSPVGMCPGLIRRHDGGLWKGPCSGLDIKNPGAESGLYILYVCTLPQSGSASEVFSH